MKKQITYFIILLLNSINLFAQTDTTQMLNTFIQNILEKSEIIPSVSIAIVSNKEVLYQETFGYADLEKQQPATSQSIYYIASCTKAFSGLLAHILAEEGKINLNAPILDYKPFNIPRTVRFIDFLLIDGLNPYIRFPCLVSTFLGRKVKPRKSNCRLSWL